ncbi:Protein of unknown function DUF1256 [Syntrophomonas zehnderi OL-4]|uniref:Sporulation protein YyaC n=1 Tax=Syntrophomonas zehnderi OL-4 TaxID=690567 RepID=A0A0E3W2G5_9FIRM|nr:spore protease YyaC [Syntrophomonas zehnderi]CFW98972.1 Protein of unknown function DUF1256 [Syntrophomonas zehnderi OL-4]
MNLFKSVQPDARESYHFEDPACFPRIERLVFTHLINMNPNFERDIVYLCIGTDRATGDCLGPIVGTRLLSMSPRFHVYGSLENPVHAVNLVKTIQEIKATHVNPLIAAIDASLGNTKRIGYINVKSGGLKPGTALNKDLPVVGDFHISAVVNVAGFLEQMVLQNTRLFLVYRMAEIIYRSLYTAHFNFEDTKKPGLTPGAKGRLPLADRLNRRG